jgi:hypothetical protein
MPLEAGAPRDLSMLPTPLTFSRNVRNYIVPSTSNTSFPLVLLDPGSVSLSMAARTRISVEEISVSGKVTASNIA